MGDAASFRLLGPIEVWQDGGRVRVTPGARQGVAFGVAGAAAEFVAPTVVIPVAGVLGLLAVAAYTVAQRSARRLATATA